MTRAIAMIATTSPPIATRPHRPMRP
jgi:hypothetical protein